MSEWVSVKEKLPRVNDEVLCINKFGYYIGNMWASGQWVDSHTYFISHVTHWMSLPDLPHDQKETEL